MKLILSLVLVVFGVSIAQARVRKVEVTGDQVVTVRTATNIATIIQVPDKPNSLVVGDQSGFKVEYLDRAITIKPLHARARSNLFIYTESRRFNVQLVTTDESVADYIVYIENVKRKIPSPVRAALVGKMTNGALVVEMIQGRKSGRNVALEFRVKSEHAEVFQPAWLWMIQKGQVVPIHVLALEKTDLVPGRFASGVIQLRAEDFDLGSSFRFELRRKRTSFVAIPKVLSWK